MGHPRLACEPTRAEQVAHHAAASGRDIGPIDVWELFAAARYATCLTEILDAQRAAG